MDIKCAPVAIKVRDIKTVKYPAQKVNEKCAFGSQENGHIPYMPCNAAKTASNFLTCFGAAPRNVLRKIQSGNKKIYLYLSDSSLNVKHFSFSTRHK